jgi:hypothetical protein
MAEQAMEGLWMQAFRPMRDSPMPVQGMQVRRMPDRLTPE